MKDLMRVMTENPRNAETPRHRLRSWITANNVFFDRNQGQIPDAGVSLSAWRLEVEGEVEHPQVFSFGDLLQLPKTIVSNTMECSGNGRSLLAQEASGNPWTIGGVGNAVWGGAWLREVLDKALVTKKAQHVAFEGYEESVGQSKARFIRSIPLEKAMTTTLLAYEMNGEPLPYNHGFPVRALALGWFGANCVKWLKTITLLEAPQEGFYMENVYRVFDEGQDSKSGEVVTAIKVKSIITQPVPKAVLSTDDIVVLGAAYGGEARIVRVEVSLDGLDGWQPAEFIGPDEPFAWRQWQCVINNVKLGSHTIYSRAIDENGVSQPLEATWNKLGYSNNGVKEHGVSFMVV